MGTCSTVDDLSPSIGRPGRATSSHVHTPANTADDVFLNQLTDRAHCVSGRHPNRQTRLQHG